MSDDTPKKPAVRNRQVTAKNADVDGELFFFPKHPNGPMTVRAASREEAEEKAGLSTNEQ